MRKLRILLDADDVLEDLTNAWVSYLNDRYGTHTCYEDITQWDMVLAFPGLTREQVYGVEGEKELFDRVRAKEGAQEYVRRLYDEGHELYVVTSTPPHAVAGKVELILRLYPYLTAKQIIICSHKQLIRGDVLLDDGWHNLEGGSYAKILFSAPYNAQYDAEAHGITRVRSWAEAYAAVQRLAEAE